MGKKKKKHRKDSLQLPHVIKAEQQETLARRRMLRKISIGLAAFAFLLYAPTLSFDFALDDYSIILENHQTQQGLSAIPKIFSSTYRYGYTITGDELYRPIPKSIFAALWQWAGENAFLFHFMNVLCYAITALVLFRLLTKLFYDARFTIHDTRFTNHDSPLTTHHSPLTTHHSRLTTLYSLLTTILFIAHPIHTEAVANIKSLDEILSLLFFLISLHLFLNFFERKKKRFIIAAASCYFLALLSKESAITFLPLFPLTVYFFRTEKFSRSLMASALPAMAAAIFLVIRSNVIGEDVSLIAASDNALLAISDLSTRKTTAVFYFGLYLFKLFFPFSLSFDYSIFQLPRASVADWRFIVPLLVMISLLVYALAFFRKKSVLSFAILFFFITSSLSSNIFFLIGTHFAERLMYVPSLGFCLGIAALLIHFLEKKKELKTSDNFSSLLKSAPILFSATGILLLLFSWKTVTRNPVWRNNLTLDESGIITAPNSMRTHYYLGNYLVKEDYYSSFPKEEQQKIIDRGMAELRKSISIYPRYGDAWLHLGVIEARINQNDSAFVHYMKALEISPGSAPAHNNIGALYFNSKKYDEAMNAFSEAVRYDPDYSDAWCNLGTAYALKGNGDEAIRDYKRAIELNPKYAMAYYFLGITYKNLGKASEANFYLQKAGELDPKYRK